MGKKGISIFLFICLFSGAVFAQKDSTRIYPYRGLLREALTYSIGSMSSLSVTNVYLAGNAEYYTDNKISVRGDGYYFLNSLNNIKIFKRNNQLYFGACFNFSAGKHFNPFIGLQPGVAFSKLYISDNTSVNPLASVVTGFNFYAEKWFHVMVNVRYSVGRHLDEFSPFDASELSFSFGLGWDLDVSCKKH